MLKLFFRQLRCGWFRKHNYLYIGDSHVEPMPIAWGGGAIVDEIHICVNCQKKIIKERTA